MASQVMGREGSARANNACSGPPANYAGVMKVGTRRVISAFSWL
jgi:hypothetical protein